MTTTIPLTLKEQLQKNVDEFEQQSTINELKIINHYCSDIIDKFKKYALEQSKLGKISCNFNYECQYVNLNKDDIHFMLNYVYISDFDKRRLDEMFFINVYDESILKLIKYIYKMFIIKFFIKYIEKYNGMSIATINQYSKDITSFHIRW